MALGATLDARVEAEAVTFSFEVRNEGTDPVDLRFPTAQTIEVIVRNAEGGDVWSSSEGRMFAQRISEASLEPGESMVMTATWDGPQPGEYTAVGELTAEPHPTAETSVAIED